MILNSEIHISHFSGFFPKIFWKPGNSPEFAFFHQFLCMGHHFHLISVTEIDFALRISNLKIFLDFFQEIFWNFSGNLEIFQSLLCLANFNILGIFPTQFRSQNLIFNSEFQISHFSGFFPEIFWKSGNSPEFAFFTNFYVWGIIFT